MGEIVEIELPAKILADIDESVKNGEFLDREEYIRYILHEYFIGDV